MRRAWWGRWWRAVAALCWAACCLPPSVHPQAGSATGGARDGWVWDWGGGPAVAPATKPKTAGLCLTAPPSAQLPCTTRPNGQCTTAVFAPASDFVNAALESTGAQSQIGLHTEHVCSDREVWEYVLTCDGGPLYCGRGPGWKVNPCGSAAVGDAVQLRRQGSAVSFEHCPVGKPCAVIHTETVAASSPALYAHVGIHNRDVEVQLCNLQPVAAAAWGWSFLLALTLSAGLYVGAGSLLGSLRGAGAGAGGDLASAVRGHPHWATWTDLGALALDGLR